MNLPKRLRHLETQQVIDFWTLAQFFPAQLERWQEMILEHYAHERLDALAARTDIPVGDILRNFAEMGMAVRFDSHWHPLFIGTDELVNAHVYARILELCEDDPRAAAAFAMAETRRVAA